MQQKEERDYQFLLIGAGLALIAAAGLFSFIRGPQSSETEASRKELEVEAAEGIPEGMTRRFTDGVIIPQEEQPDRFFAVMIENSAEAWPLSGLSQARLVFEAPVEGAIPRFMAVFDNAQEVEKIGPVRSARPYYVDWAQGLNVFYAHVGGSPEALSILSTRSIDSLNQFYFDQFFWRSSDRFAPHNVYTSTQRLSDAFDYKEIEEQTFPSFKYTQDAPFEEEKKPVNEVRVPFSSRSSDYTAVWKYSNEKNAFHRYQNQAEQIDQTGETISASNVIVLYTDISIIDEVGRRFLRTIGEGEALLFRDGRQFPVRWQKDASEDPLKLYAGEEEAALREGSTWIEVIPTSTKIDIIGADDML